MIATHAFALLVAATTCLTVGCASGSDGDEPAASSDNALTAFSFVPPPEYALDKLHSDLTPEIVARLQAVHAQTTGDAHRFIKVGDSITIATEFLRCFARTPMTGADASLEETRTFFTADSWSRATKAAKVGLHTSQPLQGNPSMLATEIAEMRPAFAVIMLGTNDAEPGAEPAYERNLSKIVQALVAQGIIPILSTIPHFRDAAANAAVPSMNLVVRKVASEAKIPLMDFHLAIDPIPGHGLSGDGVHPFAASTGACDFSTTGLRAGYNQRNRLALQALDRVRHAVLDDTPATPATETPSDDVTITEPGVGLDP